MTEHLIIGTAGHIDHGKTSLIRALTGVDLDRLPEERERGITIALGFTHLTLPSQRLASFIDAPGHERLVRTMISGATGLDAVMLCISAVEGVMPQTREHLAILELLGIGQGVVVLTMTDLVDEEMLELAQLDAEEAVEGTFLENAPILLTAAGPQPAGIAALIEALDALEPRQHPDDGIFRLPVDRAFVRRGFGTVVTGTARSGSLRDGEEVEIQPEGLRARVRGLQVHGQPVEQALPGQRTAINLANIERDDLARGMVLTRPGTIPLARILDARYRHLSGASPLQDRDRVRLLVGTAEVMAVVSLLESSRLSEGTGLIQLRTDAPLVALPGDRFVLRRESPVETLGGGHLLDPWAPRVRRKHHARAAAELHTIESGDPLPLLLRAGEAGMHPEQARLLHIHEGVLLGGRVLHPAQVARLRSTLLDALEQWHKQRPLVRGVPRRELLRGIFQRLPKQVFLELIEQLHAEGAIVLEGPRLRAAGFTVQLTPQQQAASDALEATIAAAGLQGPRADAHRSHPELLQLLLEDEVLVRVGPYLLHHVPLTAMTEKVTALLARQGSMSTSDFKDLTGLSRKYAIPLLEWLDARRITTRRGDVRVRG